MTRRFMTLLLSVSAGLTALILGFSAPASAAGATKVDLLKDAFGSCASGAAGGKPTGGFAIIHTTGNDTLMAEVSLKGATPDHTYVLSLVQTPSGENCFANEATITTNEDGNGNVNVQEPLLAGTTGAFVLVQPSDSLGFIASSPLVAVG